MVREHNSILAQARKSTTSAVLFGYRESRDLFMNANVDPAADSPSKECVACAELIMSNAKLRKRFGTLQNDPRILLGGLERTHAGGTVTRSPPTREHAR